MATELIQVLVQTMMMHVTHSYELSHLLNHLYFFINGEPLSLLRGQQLSNSFNHTAAIAILNSTTVLLNTDT